MCAGTANGIANLRAQFHDRLMHFGLDLLLEEDFSSFENFVNMRAQLARFRIDDGELLFDAESERVVFRAHGGAANLRQKHRSVIPIESRSIVDLCQIAE